MIAVKIATLGHGGNRSKAPIGALTQGQAAELLNVSERSVERAASVAKRAVAEVVNKVVAGEISLNAATKIAQKPPEEQRKVITRHSANTGNDEWCTPKKYIDLARAVLGEIDLDPATNLYAQEYIQAKQFYTKDNDGLAHRWRGRIWLNPPYSKPLLAKFVSNLCNEYGNGGVEAILLTHANSDTEWFHCAAAHAAAICFTRGRIAFERPDTDQDSPTQGQTFFYFGPRDRIKKFAAEFQTIGFVMAPVGMGSLSERKMRTSALWRRDVEEVGDAT
jgi:ParB family chromosome partitioning protein